nr:MAG: hypothetical protein J07AB56_08740 [Candidatus Nanosalinarum sp. J07AB56]
MEQSSLAALLAISTLVIASGCVGSTPDRSLDSDIEIETVDAQINQSGQTLLDEALSTTAEAPRYSAESSGRLIADIAVIGTSVNFSTDEEVTPNATTINRSLVVGIAVGNNTNASEVRSRVVSDADGTRREVFTDSGADGTQAGPTQISEDVSAAAERIRNIDFTGAEVEGRSNRTGDIVLRTDARPRSLWNYIQESSNASTVQDSGETGSSAMNSSESYLWVDDQSRVQRFSFYVSFGNRSAEARSTTRFSY